MSTALVMLMLPGLALFYGGLVRANNVLSTIMHSFFGLALVSVVWVIVGFSLAFGPDVSLPILGSGWIGGLDYIGPEFLTWLWWRSDEEPRFVQADGTEVFVHVDEHLEFRGERAASRRTVLRAGLPGASMDARAALRSGKLVFAARLLLARGEDEVRFTLRAEDLEVSTRTVDGDWAMARMWLSRELGDA